MFAGESSCFLKLKKITPIKTKLSKQNYQYQRFFSLFTKFHHTEISDSTINYSVIHSDYLNMIPGENIRHDIKLLSEGIPVLLSLKCASFIIHHVCSTG